jgi:hypothetical protein
MRLCVAVFGLLLASMVYGQSASDAVHISSIKGNPTDPKVIERCGMSFVTPNLKTVSDQAIGFGCTGSFKDGEQAVMDMDFQYDPNFDPSGGDNISFVVEGVGVDSKISSGKGSVFQLISGRRDPILSPLATYKESNCGAPIVKTVVSPIAGENWHGWVAEETFGKGRPKCVPEKEFTDRYRCVHVMIGNDRMSAQLIGVCLLRKKEYSLENGFSYDLFFNMMKSLRFVTN